MTLKKTPVINLVVHHSNVAPIATALAAPTLIFVSAILVIALAVSFAVESAYMSDVSPLYAQVPGPHSGQTGFMPASVATSSLAVWLTRALPETTHIVVVQLLNTESHWNAAGTTIVTDQQLAVLQPLLGTTPDVITIQTDGGYIADESIGLWVSHGVEIDSSAPQLLLLASETNKYRVVGGEEGVFTLSDGQIINPHWGIALSTPSFVGLLNRELSHQKRNTIAANMPFVGSIGSQPMKEIVVADGTPVPFDTHVSGSGNNDDTPRWVVGSVELDIWVNLNSTQIDDATRSRGDFHRSIARALRTWSVVEAADFSLLYAGETDATTTGYNGVNEIIFVTEGRNRPLGQAQIWYTPDNLIVEVDMWINDAYALNVGDSEPAFGEIDLESVVLHELGHWVPLDHDPNAEAVMYSVLGPQQSKRTLAAVDIDRLVALYPCAVPPCIHPSHEGEPATPTSTPIPPTPTATSTPTLSPTAATPTLISTTSPDSHAIYLPIVTR